jgi:hypothetical protein
VNLLAKQADKALGMIKEGQDRELEDGYRASLHLEFLELARIYDRFFLVMSVIATIVTSAGILMSSPYSSSSSGI